MVDDLKGLAKTYFRGVYGGDPSVVDALADDGIVMSYPVFEKIFQTAVIQGREAARRFVVGFASRWRDAQITFDEVVAEGNLVVLVWRYSALNVGRIQEDEDPSHGVHSWGGMTLFRFNELGKIVAEIGEESSPGPYGRLTV